MFGLETSRIKRSVQKNLCLVERSLLNVFKKPTARLERRAPPETRLPMYKRSVERPVYHGCVLFS